MSTLAGKVVCIASQGPSVGDALATGMAAQAARVARITDQSGDAKHCDFSSRDTVIEAFAQACAASGPPRLVVISALPKAATQSQPINDMSDAQWQASCRAVMRTTLYCLQAARATVREKCAIAVLGPAFSFCGAAGLVALSAAAEAQRALVKSAARQWGADGITVNWIAAAADVLSPDFGDATLPFRPERVPVALGYRPGLAEDIVPVMAFLASPAGRRITGASLNLDGGEWMLP